MKIEVSKGLSFMRSILDRTSFLAFSCYLTKLYCFNSHIFISPPENRFMG